MRTATFTNTLYTTPAYVPARVLRTVRNVALFALAPFVALAYVVLFPFVGLGMLAYAAAKK